jgi:hypothetical protein
MPNVGRSEIVVVAVLLAASLVTAAVLPRPTAAGLIGRYWDNTNWRGTPLVEAVGSMPTGKDFERHLPAAARAGGSAEWTGFLLVEDAGSHQFDLLSDQGAWLYVHEMLVAGNGAHGRQATTGRINLYAGQHVLRVRYFQPGGGAALQIRWTRPGARAHLLREDDLAPAKRTAGARRWLPLVRVLSVAIPVVWGCLFLYVPVRLAGAWAWREVERVTSRIGDRRALGLTLLLGFGLVIWGIEWGLVDTWGVDELRPGLVREVIERRFSDGWYDKYPLMHYAVLAIPVSAFEIAGRYSILASDSLLSHVAQLAMMRLVSVIMGLGTLLAAYLCGVELYGPRRAVLATLALLLTPLFVYYGKTANLDIPFMCWFGWALLAFLRILRTNRCADYVRLGLAAAAAVATKDQAYASLALLPLAVVFVNARQQSSPTWWGRLAAAVVDRRVLAAGGAAAVAFAVLHNVMFNFGGIVSHFRLLSNVADIAVVPRTFAGYAELSARTVDSFRLALGWPLFVMAVIGIASATARKERRWWLWLLVVPLSFHLTFTWVVLYICDRYLFGGIFVLALFAGSALSDLMENRRWWPAAWTTVAGSLVYSLLYASSINVMMNRDSRNVARGWVLAHADEGASVGMIGAYLPSMGPPIDGVRLGASAADVMQVKPDWIMLNARFARRFETERSPAGRELLDALKNGTLGYSEAFRYRAPMPAWAFLQYDAQFRGSGESVLTNLDKVNPEMTVYRRRDR